MKKSYHSMAVPLVDAMTALRSCVLWPNADSVPHVAIVAICVRPTHFVALVELREARPHPWAGGGLARRKK
jgi:hypothetical protein